MGQRHQAASRRTILKLAASGAFGAAGILGLVRDALASGTHPAVQGIRHIKGLVTIDGKPAAVGQAIQPGQVIATGKGGEAIYVIGADAFLLHENSSFSFGNSSAGKAALRYISGKILSVFGSGAKELHTKTATIGIRGTACYIEIEPARIYFCLCYGEAEITPTADPTKKQTIKTQHHESPMYIDSRPGRTMMPPAGVINHTDSELVMLENLVGRFPPFYGKESKY